MTGQPRYDLIKNEIRSEIFLEILNKCIRYKNIKLQVFVLLKIMFWISSRQQNIKCQTEEIENLVPVVF